MVILKIKEKGYYITIPGITPFRTPAEVDITSANLAIVVSVLHSNGIDKFEIVSDTPGKQKTLTQNDFNIFKKEEKEEKNDKKYDDLTDQIGELKGMINKLLQRNVIEKREQIIERVFEKIPTKPVVEEVEELFIPEINIPNARIKSKTETINKEGDVFVNVDLLSKLKDGGRKNG
jgi:hypothetical protein